MKCNMFEKPCDLLTCHRKKRCLWTEEEVQKIRVKVLNDPWDVLDALRGGISGDYQKDLARLKKDNKTCSESVYQQAYQMDQQP